MLYVVLFHQQEIANTCRTVLSIKYPTKIIQAASRQILINKINCDDSDCVNTEILIVVLPKEVYNELAPDRWLQSFSRTFGIVSCAASCNYSTDFIKWTISNDLVVDDIKNVIKAITNYVRETMIKSFDDMVASVMQQTAGKTIPQFSKVMDDLKDAE